MDRDDGILALEQPTFTSLWASKVVDLTEIDVPAYSITGWSSVALHLRGTIAAWKAFSSKHKYLRVHAGREWEQYYNDDGQRRQKAFWDCFLKDLPTEVDGWPLIEIDVRTIENFTPRFEQSWPPHNAELTSLFLSGNTLEAEVSAASIPTDAISYQSHLRYGENASANFDYRFTTRTEITGDICLKLYVQAQQFPDTDIFVAVKKVNKTGQEVQFYNQSQTQEASAAHGWREYSHEGPRRLWVTPDEIVSAEIEVWPSSTVWEEGETLRVTVQGHSFFSEESPVTSKHALSHNFGEVKIWYGQAYPSQLLVPVIKNL
ncbi:uncharacterized protein A1O9_09874 [Exophiala aquamarina CBS 119918]|uniref:Xaa-Pro dipeptidyl-peptidase C-terminal domain-containing protein n=1 Tax=Exophiala aquamarina CBS 119918 TaxID=1182545 RepID=A0A072P1S6_9EURO|nr:uncharacterized protein A1O9_09874 [Exophiala aquamarina CBS 119918]KEF54079.1 hypothetical protein A1O9_09874 [Exophiala aquamarina CBS 119918]